MQNAAFAAHGIAAEYELRPLEAKEVASFFSEIRGPGYLGFGVTAPYKQVAMRHLDVVEDGASAIGAVNNGLRRDDGALVGFNTDAPGFISAVESSGHQVSGRRAVVVGAGGAARAVVFALLDAGAESVYVANRTFERARDLALSFESLGVIVPGPIAGAETSEAMEAASIAVNATTVGMTTQDLPFEVAMLPSDALVFDLVYVPTATPLLQAARARGLAVCNGLEMLIRQGELAFARWTGIASTAQIMRNALYEWDPSLRPTGRS